MAKAKKEEMAQINPFYETMVGKAFNIDYGPMRAPEMKTGRRAFRWPGVVNVRMTMTDQQPWTCEKCGKSGVVAHDEHADVYSVLHLIQDDHQRLSPGCAFDVRRVRVDNNPEPVATRN